MPLYATPDNFLGELLDSIMNQTYQNFEVCLADGSEGGKDKEEFIKKYIEENFNENDVMSVQGNWGYTYNIVKWSIEKKLVPVYSYTERNVEEIKDGENVKKISYFKHVKFIEYV